MPSTGRGYREFHINPSLFSWLLFQHLFKIFSKYNLFLQNVEEYPFVSDFHILFVHMVNIRGMSSTVGGYREFLLKPSLFSWLLAYPSPKRGPRPLLMSAFCLRLSFVCGQPSEGCFSLANIMNFISTHSSPSLAFCFKLSSFPQPNDVPPFSRLLSPLCGQSWGMPSIVGRYREFHINNLSSLAFSDLFIDFGKTPVNSLLF